MISSLSNSFRAISLYDASAKSILAPIQSLCVQLRFKSVEEKLGLPAKPKRPTAPYFRFANENRPSVTAKHPKLKSFEINLILGKMWQSLDAATERNIKWDTRPTLSITSYSNEYTDYKLSLSDADKRGIKEMKAEIKKRRILTAKQRELRRLGKPKKPLNSFFRYLMSQKDRKSNKPYTEYSKRVTARWNALSDAEKVKYSTTAEEDAKYKQALLKWEQEMLKLEHENVVRSATKELPGEPVASKK